RSGVTVFGIPARRFAGSSCPQLAWQRAGSRPCPGTLCHPQADHFSAANENEQQAGKRSASGSDINRGPRRTLSRLHRRCFDGGSKKRSATREESLGRAQKSFARRRSHSLGGFEGGLTRA